MKKIITIKNINYFKIKEDNEERYFYGSDQEWYPAKWQRMAGCGPSAVTNILYYLSFHGHENSQEFVLRSAYLQFMEQVWEYVRPTIQGIPKTSILKKGIMAYGRAKHLPLDVYTLDVPKEKRPDFLTVLKFIESGLAGDVPVAFLNLHNGEEKMLDSWHWVTIISLEYEEDGRKAGITILDAGSIKKVDFKKWFKTTRAGGGFVIILPNISASS